MRHWLLALMIVLLPLRGWMGDAMATDMATSGAVTTKIIAHSVYKTSASSQSGYETESLTTSMDVAQTHPDCGGHAPENAAAADGTYKAHDMQDEHCQPCQSCQVCHTVAAALSPPAARSIAILSFKSQPDTAAPAFVNADVALSKKPPIS